MIEMSDSTRQMLAEHLEATRDILDVIVAAMDGEPSADFEDNYGDDADAFDVLHERPLEVVWEMGEPFAVVLGTGGPHVEIRGGTRHDGSGYALHGYWGGEHVTLRGASITRVGEYFRELCEESG